MNDLKIISKQELDQLVSKRAGETKLGEVMFTLEEGDWEQLLKATPAKFVLLGVPEDIGVRANFGIGGAHTLWLPALKAIANVQHTVSLQGLAIAVLGAFDFSNWISASEKMETTELRKLVDSIDDVVFPVIKKIADAGKIPIIIGGGHNNAYPILKGISRAKSKAINCISLDAHSDYRAIEGRHSGNGFRYAKMDGYLKRYSVIGLHRNYNSQVIIDEMVSDPDLQLYFYEDLFIEGSVDFRYSIDQAVHFTAGESTGIEVDLDCIERTLASAATPCGMTTADARRFLTRIAQSSDIAYLHITEGSTKMVDGREDIMTAKLVAYLVTDFIRAYTNSPMVYIRQTQL